MDEGAGTKLKKMIIKRRAKVIEMALCLDEVEPTPEARKAWRDKYDEVAGDMERLLLAYNARRGLGSFQQNLDDEEVEHPTEASGA